MIEYLLLKPDGTVLQRGHCPTEADIPVVPGTTHTVIAPSDSRRPYVAPPTVRELRQMAYPSIGDQLDVLWKIIESNNIALPAEGTAMLAKVKAVKTQYPKE